MAVSDKVKNSYFGMNLIWFFGVVEDRNDPLKLGRVRVRCYTYHTEDKKKLPTEALPWAQCVQSITSAAISGVGRSPTGLVEGTWVVGFFLDGEKSQQPMVIGSIAGIPTELPNKEKGFNDPNGVYPSYINEPDVDKLARNESPDLPTIKNANRKIGSIIPHGQGTWDEPTDKYTASYPKNHVWRTESGHVIEVDDTPNNERIQEYHKSGTFREISASGNTVTRVVGDNYTIIAKNDYVRVEGKVNLHINQDCNTYIKGDWNILIDGNKKEVIKGRYDLDITGEKGDGELDIEAKVIHLNKTSQYS
jgi:hypothetical protein